MSVNIICRYLLFISFVIVSLYYYCYTLFSLSIDIPEAPLNVEATAQAILQAQLFEIECVILVKWDPPANGVDITRYMVYVPALNMNVTTNSLMTSLPLRDCSERFDATVAAINRFDCIGMNSSVTLPSTSESSKHYIT